MPKPYDRTTHDGNTVDWLTKTALLEAERRLGYPLTITQGSYNAGGVSASAGTHDGGGVVDLAAWDQENKVRVLRAVGFAAWYRPAISGLWPSHIHAVLIGNANLAPVAAQQVVAYRNGRDGLKSNRYDPTPRPNPIPTWKWVDPESKPKPKPAPKPEPKPEPKPAGPTHTRNGGSWNLRVGRNPDVVTREVREFLYAQDLDFLTICEAADYIDALTDSLQGYTVHAKFDGDGPARDSAVIVRNGRKVTDLRTHRLERIGWERKPGRIGLHWPRSAVSVDVEGLRVMSVHMPPGPFEGPRFWRRGVAFDTSARKLRRIGLRWFDRPWVMAGDWNVGKRVAGTDQDPSAAWIASETGARIKGDGIDYVMHRGCRVSGYARHDFGTSDHRPITFTVAL